MSDDDDFEMGELRVRVGKSPSEPTVTNLYVDRLACDRQGLLYLLSAVGPQGAVKGLRASLTAKAASTYELSNVRCEDGQGKGGHAKGFHAGEGRKFAVRHHPLGFGQIHALFLSLDHGFLKSDSHAAVFAALKRPEYTTPVLQSWVPWVSEDLKKKGLMSPLFCFRCRCSLISAADADLDASVSEGVKSGRLLFRELNLVGSET